MARFHYQESPTQKQKKSFKKYLSEDEELVLVTGLGKTYLRSHLIVGIGWPGIIFILGGLGLAYLFQFNLGYGMLTGLIIASVVAYCKTLLTYHGHRYLLTTRRVIIKKGVFTVQITSALFDKITHIEVDQPFLDKIIYHHGTVVINTAGTNKGEITLKFVGYPIELKNLLERLINREREQFGLHGATLTEVEGEIIS